MSVTLLYPLRWSAVGGIVALALAVAAHASLADRQATVNVKVQNLTGAALAGATVKIDMLDPSFRIGDAVTIDEITPGAGGYSANTVKYLQQYFNSVTLGNELKWAPFESRPLATTISYIQRVMALKAFNSTDAMRLRGHTTIWGSSYQVPADVKAMTDPVALQTRIQDHVTQYHTSLKGLGIDCFDLYNEPFHERTYIMAKLAPGTPTAAQEAVQIAPWFKKAKDADPTAQLFINEYNMLNFWQEDDADIKKYKALIDAIRDAGGEIGGIGLQGHMDRMITKDQATRRLRILAAPMAPTAAHPNGLPGLPIEVTELDVNTQVWAATPQQQADVVANILDAAFETTIDDTSKQLVVQGITIWGMNDSTHWRKNAVLFDDSDPTNWKVKPSGQALLDRVTGTWWTKVSGTTDATGSFGTAVFKGKHKITVDYNGQTQEVVQNLPTADGDVLVQFDTGPIDTSHSRLSNMSVRTPLSAKQQLTIGFVVRGGSMPVLLRAAGPALTTLGVPGAMPDPRVTVYHGTAVTGTNDNWDTSLSGVFGSMGAFPFEVGSKDAATTFSTAATDAPDSNTAIVTGDDAGVIVVEAYDRGASNAPGRFVNVSALNFVGTGDSVLIAGFNVTGTGYKRLLIRGVGPQLAKAPFNVPNVLADPKVELYRLNGPLLQTNDDWSGLDAVFDSVGAFKLDAGSKDAAMVVVVPPGSYTAVVSGVNNTTGNAIVEVYELP